MKRIIQAAVMIATATITFTISGNIETQQRKVHSFTPCDMIAVLPTQGPTPTATPTATPTPTPEQIFHNKLNDIVQTEEIKTTTIELEYIGTYFVTAYCPAECGGSWQTASGITCHRSEYKDRLYKPTTCAVDPRLHNIGSEGDLFYIKEFDRVFKAEDTGGNVKGKWLDLFYVDYSDVLSFPTGYYEVYKVNYKEITISKGELND